MLKFIIPIAIIASVAAAAGFVIATQKRKKPEILIATTPEYDVIQRENKMYYRDLETGEEMPIEEICRVNTAEIAPEEYSDNESFMMAVASRCPVEYSICAPILDETQEIYGFWRII